MSHLGPPVSAFITPANVRHYGIAEPEADDEWNALTPNNGIIYLGLEKRPFSISMFHQLRCLDIIRKSIRDRASKGPSNLDNHCLNYLRQMILCSSPTEVDLFSGLNGQIPIYSMRTCNNWSAVYSEVQGNLGQVATRERWVYCSDFVRDRTQYYNTCILANTQCRNFFSLLSFIRLFIME